MPLIIDSNTEQIKTTNSKLGLCTRSSNTDSISVYTSGAVINGTEIVDSTIQSNVADGTSPLIITSRTKVDNLNVERVDDRHESDFLLTDGSRELSGNWDAGSYEIRSQTYQSDIVTGTAPLIVASTTKVTNLNADSVDGMGEFDFVTTSPSGSTRNVIQSTVDAIPVIIKANAAQTTDLLEFQTNAGANLTVVNLSGNIGIGTSTFGTVNKLTVNPNVTTDNLATAQFNCANDAHKALVLQRKSATQSANIFEVQASDGTAYGVIDSSFRMAVGTTTTSSRLYVRGIADEKQVLIVGNGTQTNNLFEIENNSFDTLAKFDSDGRFTLSPSIVTSGTPTAFTITAAANTGITANTECIGANLNYSATKTWASLAGTLATQREIIVQAPTYAATIAGTITDAVTMSISGAPIAGANTTLTNAYALRVNSGQATATAIVAKGAASQTASILQVQDSSGNMVWGMNTQRSSQRSGNFAAAGDAQTTLWTLRNNTTDATQTILYIDGSATKLSVTSGKTYTFVIDIVAAQTGGASGSVGDSWGYQLLGVVRNISGTTSLQGSIIKTIIAEADGAFDVDAQANDTTDTIDVLVTGAANKNVRWVAKTRLTEVAFA